MTPDDPRHGSYAGVAAHRRAGQPMCDACVTARRDYRTKHAKPVNSTCRDCAKPCSYDAQRCRDCALKAARAERSARAKDAAERRAFEAERARVRRENDYPEAEIAYVGGWVRRGLVLVPTSRQPEFASPSRPNVTPAPCGSEAAYYHHLKLRDTATSDRVVTCEPCLEAHRMVEQIRAARRRLKAAS